LGGKIKDFSTYLQNQNAKDLVHQLESQQEMEISLGGESHSITKEYLDVRIDAKEGFSVAMENNLFTILDTNLTPELVQEGLSRELISKVQQMRKQKDFEMMDRIHILLHADQEVWDAVAAHREHIMSETLALEIVDSKESLNPADINGRPISLDVQRVSL
jgi:isoleucyl-tRNA synthetase